MNKFSLYIPDLLDASTEYVEVEDADELKVMLGGNSIACWKTVNHGSDYIDVRVNKDEIYLRIGKAAGKDDQILTMISTPEFIESECEFPYGQYCVTYINKSSANVLIITDLMGIRGLFAKRVGVAGWLISSQVIDIKILSDLSGVDIDIGSRSFLMRYAYLKRGSTIYRGVRELLPACVYGIAGETIKQYNKRLKYSGSSSIDVNDYAETLHLYIESVVKEQLGCNKGKVGVLLGGFDSALVAAYLVRAGADVEAFTFCYSDNRFDQPFVVEACEFLNIKHHWVKIDAELFGKELLQYSEVCNQPTVWPGYVLQTKFLCEEMLKHDVKTCFSGDGCDTLFMGYPSTYRRGYIYQNIPKLNARVSDFITRVTDSLGFEYLFGHVYRVFRSLLNAAAYPKEDRPFFSFQVFNDWSLSRLGFGSVNVREESSNYLLDLAENNKDVGYFRKMYIAKSLISPNRQKILAASTASGLSVESPYMHPRLKGFASSIPESYLRVEGRSVTDEGKELLMQMAEKYALLPAEVIRQKKLAAIVSPIDAWYATKLKQELINYLTEDNVNISTAYVASLLDDLVAERIYKRYFSSDMVTSLAISLLVTYATFT